MSGRVRGDRETRRAAWLAYMTAAVSGAVFCSGCGTLIRGRLYGEPTVAIAPVLCGHCHSRTRAKQFDASQGDV
jgi:hypothetical protein